MKALQPGTALQNGKYTIIQTLGQGSFGITYLATTKIPVQGGIGKMDIKVKVAIKEFFMADMNSRSADGTTIEKTDSSIVKKYTRKFQTEAENLAKLHHPNIVQVLEVFNENNTSYYVMEYIEGETLDDYIKRNGRLDEEQAKKITLDICGALHHMHDHHMLHLDLKPKNVMRDNNGTIYLIDFGLAKQYNENGEPESSTTLGLGTRGYAPVEQMKYKSDGTMPATLDIYALGGTLYKMLTGQVPPESSDVLNDGLPVSLLQNAGVSDSMIAIVEKAMAPLKKNRYQQVGELVDALTFNNEYAEKTIIEQQNEETVINEETKLEHPPYNYQAPPNNNQTPPYYDEVEEPSFLQKYWKYGIAALIPLLILGGVLLFSNGKDNVSEYEVISANDKEGEVEDTKDVVEEAEVTAEDPKPAEKAAEDAKETAKETAEKTKEDAKDMEKDAKGAADKTVEPPAKPVEAAKPEPPKPESHYVTEAPPSFPGGTEGLFSWISTHLRYPPVAQENNIAGTVQVSFVVDIDGSVTDVKVVRGVDPSLDKEAVRLVSSMPKWSPGTQNGKPLRVSYTIPIKFQLR